MRRLRTRTHMSSPGLTMLSTRRIAEHLAQPLHDALAQPIAW